MIFLKMNLTRISLVMRIKVVVDGGYDFRKFDNQLKTNIPIYISNIGGFINVEESEKWLKDLYLEGINYLDIPKKDFNLIERTLKIIDMDIYIDRSHIINEILK